MKYCLCYTSKESQLFSQKELSDLITESYQRNQSKKINSTFIYNRGSIFQKFEGKKETIHELFEKIKVDKRHYHINLIFEGMIIDSMIEKKHLLGLDLETWDHMNEFLNNRFQDEVFIQDHFQGSKSYIDEILKSEVKNSEILSLEPLDLKIPDMEERINLDMA